MYPWISLFLVVCVSARGLTWCERLRTATEYQGGSPEGGYFCTIDTVFSAASDALGEITAAESGALGKIVKCLAGDNHWKVHCHFASHDETSTFLAGLTERIIPSQMRLQMVRRSETPCQLLFAGVCVHEVGVELYLTFVPV